MITDILTARLDSNAQEIFNNLRQKYFPGELNFLDAHLTLFHKLPQALEIQQILESVSYTQFKATVDTIKSIGRGVAYFIHSPELSNLHHHLVKDFKKHLISQDLQPFRPHITIQNKVNPAEAQALLKELNQNFKPFEISFHGLDLWHYLNGPWQHSRFFPFKELD
ncbi:2'-5' RNA ligase family protein [Pedobacter mucosus]|uniref:2'-5' RNA ligase family protein n=1 Tax=Pedobacter mucosus TaxID=2895286 RepID=UPI001EE41C0E|nr:2'-5' RNA ligase family protein [Pedobacter mucosus]UKT64963.1 2'-5' RNA ligase family protein [Pedobacter mucosus]